MSQSKILFYFCLSFIIGIFFESVWDLPQFILWFFLLLGVLLIILDFLRYKNYLLIAGFCILFLVLGILRMQISEFNILQDKLSKLNGAGEIVLTGQIISEPDIRNASQKLKVKVQDSLILVTTNKYPEFKYLDKVELTGKLEAPFETEDFSYKNYLLKDHIYSVMDFPKILALGREPEPSISQKIYSGILKIKQKLRESIRRGFSPPQSVILEGTILGDNGAMSKDLKDRLNITGLRHIIAVSGTHIVILSIILMSLLLALGFWRNQAFYISIIFVVFYIVLTGLPASGIRAGIMGGLYLLAQKLGRQSTGPRVVVMAAGAMLAINPLLLLYDVGFQLSFLAVLGLIYIEPFIKNFFKNILLKFLKEKNYKNVKNFLGIFSATFAAQIFTLPVMVYNFGNVSLVAPVTNLLILPIVDLLMIFGFVSSFVGIFSYTAGWILSAPTWFLLTYFVKVIDIFSQPWAIKTFKNVNFIWLIISYFLIGLIVAYIKKKERLKFLG